MKEFVEKLIGRLEEIRDRYQNRYVFYSYSVDYGKVIGLNDAIAIVKELAKEFATDTNVVSKDGWIPCSERLPEVDVYVLCQGNHSMFIACVDSLDNKWRDCHFITRTTVKAWHPLPQPYKPQKEAEWKDKVMKHFTKVE